MNEWHHIDEWVTSHRWMSDITSMNEWHHIDEWVTSHKWMSDIARDARRRDSTSTSDVRRRAVNLQRTIHVTHLNESRLTLNESRHSFRSRHSSQRVTSHIWTNLVTHLNESRHTYEWVTTHTWMSQFTHLNRKLLGMECDALPAWSQCVTSTSME